jgi:hypothetical protein
MPDCCASPTPFALEVLPCSSRLPSRERARAQLEAITSGPVPGDGQMIDEAKARNINAGRKYDRHSRAATTPRDKGHTFIFCLTLGQGGWLWAKEVVL